MSEMTDSETTLCTMEYKYDEIKFTTAFIDLYHSFPALWQVTSHEYRNKGLKAIGYDILIEKLSEINANADRDAVIKKINSLRTCYRTELKRVRKELSLGNTYEPTLWYFDKLAFLEDQESLNEMNLSNADEDNDTLFQNSLFSVKSSPDCSPRNLSSPLSNHFEENKPSIKRKHQTNDSNSKLIKKQKPYESSAERPNQRSTVSNQYEDLNDDFTIMGKRFASQLRSLDDYQRTCAEKIIADVIFYGKLERLTEFSILQIATLPRQIRPFNPNNE